MSRVGLIGLVKIELPSATVLLCDGGFIEFAGETYKSADPVFGTIGSARAIEEGVGNEVPAAEIEMLPPGSTAPADLSAPGFQRSKFWSWTAEYDVDAGTLVPGTEKLGFYGQIDQTTLTVGRNERSLAMSIVAEAEKFFERNIGNSLSDSWHESVWANEKGHANATGMYVPVAWGAETPPRNATSIKAGYYTYG